jgi:hypothetical protein
LVLFGISAASGLFVGIVWAYCSVVDPSLSDSEQTRDILERMFVRGGAFTGPPLIVCVIAAVEPVEPLHEQAIAGVHPLDFLEEAREPDRRRRHVHGELQFLLALPVSRPERKERQAPTASGYDGGYHGSALDVSGFVRGGNGLSYG